jgi:hypothetical protein
VGSLGVVKGNVIYLFRMADMMEGSQPFKKKVVEVGRLVGR